MHDMIEWVLRVVAVIAFIFAGQKHVPGVMIVVVPLCAIFAARGIGGGGGEQEGVVIDVELTECVIPRHVARERRAERVGMNKNYRESRNPYYKRDPSAPRLHSSVGMTLIYLK